MGKKITDFGSDAVTALNSNVNEEQIDETYGINVQFEESEEESDNDMYGEIRDEDGQEEGEEARIDHTLHAENVSIKYDTKNGYKIPRISGSINYIHICIYALMRISEKIINILFIRMYAFL